MASSSSMRYQRRERRRSAATLIELLSVVAVLAILAAIAIGAISGMRRRSLIVRTRAEVSALANALEDYKRFYGDYPQLGEFTHATITPSGISATNPTGNGPGAGTAEAKLFNCLTGVFGPRAFSGTDRVNGPNFLEGSRFLAASSSSLNGTLTTTFLVPTANRNAPPSKVEQNVCLVDPWGNRYLYYYKNRQNPANWQGTSYLLYSVGPDGAHTPPGANGVLTPTQISALNNADNIYANQ